MPAVDLPTYTAVRYAVPLREGGSLPAVVETAEAGLFVTKFRGAAQGTRPLIAELVVGLLAARLDLNVPAVALIALDPSFGRTEGDPEIQDLLRASHGLNVGLQYLDGAFAYDPVARAPGIDPDLAAEIVWLDAFVSNVDRTANNTNLLVWQRAVWLIDHGAALTFHFNWRAADEKRAMAPFPLIRDHVLLSQAGDLAAADSRLADRLDPDFFAEVMSWVPDSLLVPDIERATIPFDTPDEVRAAYVSVLSRRLLPPRAFVATAVVARAEALRATAQQRAYRR